MESIDYYSLFFEENTDSNSTSLSSSDGTEPCEIIAISIGAFMVSLVFFLILCCCCSAGFAAWVDEVINSSNNGDEAYADIALRRMEEEKEKKKEDPEVRRKKLLQSFESNKVSMVVSKDSYVPEKVLKKGDHDQGSDSSLTTNSTHSDNGSLDEDDNEEAHESNVVTPVFDDIESNDESTEIYLNSSTKNKRTGEESKLTVPNSCAICLCSYDIDDVVVWSSNKDCVHAFHEECILQWLVKNQNGECPCCRTQFTDLPRPGEKAEKVRLSLPQSFRGWRLQYNFLSQRESPSDGPAATTDETAAVPATDENQIV